MALHQYHSVCLGILSTLIIFVLSSCSDDNSPPENTYTYTIPKPDDDWETADLTDVDLEKSAFETIFDTRDMESLNIHSILVIKNNTLVLEEYFPGEDIEGNTFDYDRNTPHEVYSVTKSITSLLIGIAIEQGVIASIDDEISTYLPDYSALLNTDAKADITLYDSLTMQTGILWDEFGQARVDGPTIQFMQADDPIYHLFNLPLASPPGSAFNYNTGISSIMGEIIFNANGQNVDNFANDNLFSPLNISDVTWLQHENGLIFTGTGLRLRPRDMAKIGQLILNNGTWEGSEIVNGNWLDESTSTHVTFPGLPASYGYYWWLDEPLLSDGSTTPLIYAAGFGGQNIFVLPEFEMTVVFTSGNFGTENARITSEILKEDIILSLTR